MQHPFPSSAPPIVEIHRVTRQFGNKTALDDVSLTVPRGGVFGLIGGNGAGKTTLIKHILGMLKAQSGSVRVFGLDPVENPVGTLGRIGYLSEDRDLPNWMRVGELMRYTQAFFPNWDAAYAEELREAFDLDGNARVKTLSRGQRARAGLLVALAHRPELLVLDEPSSGLDPVVRRDILGAIIRTIADEGRTSRRSRGDHSSGANHAHRADGRDQRVSSPRDTAIWPSRRSAAVISWNAVVRGAGGRVDLGPAQK